MTKKVVTAVEILKFFEKFADELNDVAVEVMRIPEADLGEEAATLAPALQYVFMQVKAMTTSLALNSEEELEREFGGGAKGFKKLAGSFSAQYSEAMKDAEGVYPDAFKDETFDIRDSVKCAALLDHVTKKARKLLQSPEFKAIERGMGGAARAYFAMKGGLGAMVEDQLVGDLKKVVEKYKREHPDVDLEESLGELVRVRPAF